MVSSFGDTDQAMSISASSTGSIGAGSPGLPRRALIAKFLKNSTNRDSPSKGMVGLRHPEAPRKVHPGATQKPENSTSRIPRTEQTPRRQPVHSRSQPQSQTPRRHADTLTVREGILRTTQRTDRQEQISLQIEKHKSVRTNHSGESHLKTSIES